MAQYKQKGKQSGKLIKSPVSSAGERANKKCTTSQADWPNPVDISEQTENTKRTYTDYETDENRSLIKICIGDRIVPTIVDTASSISIWPKQELPKNSLLIPYKTQIRGIANKVIELQQVALIKFKVGSTYYSHYFRIMDNSHLCPIIGQDLLKRLLAKIDLERNIVSFYKMLRKAFLEK